MIIAEIKERELMSKNLSKYVASFEYFDKSLIVLSIATGSISITSFATVIGTPVGMKVVVIFNYYRICKKTIKNNKK